MGLTFIKWIELQEELEISSDETLNEVFGRFFSKTSTEEKKRALAKKQFDERKAKRDQENKEKENSKQKSERVVAGKKLTPSLTTSKAAQDKSAERDWLEGII